MRVFLQIENMLVQAEIDEKDVPVLYGVFKNIKKYTKPDREPDFKHHGHSYYTNEGLVAGLGKIYDAFYNSSKEAIGLREVSIKRLLKNAIYIQDKEIVNKYKRSVANNVLLKGLYEPNNFGKVPKK